MENDNIENQDSLNLDEDLNLEETTPEVDVEKLKETNRKLFERAKKAEAQLKQVKPQITRTEEPSSPPSQVEDKVWQIAEMIREGYDRNDVDFIMKNGGQNALKDPNSYVAIALKAKVEQREAERQASKTSNSSGMSEVERKYTPEQLGNMTSEELEKILPKAQ